MNSWGEIHSHGYRAHLSFWGLRSSWVVSACFLPSLPLSPPSELMAVSSPLCVFLQERQKAERTGNPSLLVPSYAKCTQAEITRLCGALTAWEGREETSREGRNQKSWTSPLRAMRSKRASLLCASAFILITGHGVWGSSLSPLLHC